MHTPEADVFHSVTISLVFPMS